MAYAVVADVEREYKTIDFAAAGSQVSTADVTTFITEADAEIDSKIGLKYVTPVASGGGLVTLRQISVWLVKDRLEPILNVKTGIAKTEQGSEEETLREKAIKMLDEIAAGTRLLAGATLKSSHDGVKSFAVDEGLDFTFKKGTAQW